MKAPTTYLANRAMAKQGQSTDGLEVWRDAVQPEVAEPLVDACLFSRPSNYAKNLGARQFGMLGNAMRKQSQKQAAGGLPAHFVLAVTADSVVVLERVIGGRDPVGKAGPELARWSRATLDVSWVGATYLYNVTITTPDSPERVRCCVGQSPLAESFLQLLADPARTTPAVG
jgi:hypothetical protein